MKLLKDHGEKLLLIAVVLVATYAFYSAVGSMQTRTVVSDETFASLESMNAAFSDPSPNVSWPEPGHADALAKRFGNTGALVSGQFRVGAWVAHPPVLLMDRKDFVAGTFGPVSGLSARPEIGRVQLSWNAPATATVYQTPEGREQSANFVEILQYAVYRRAEGEKYPDTPSFVVQQPTIVDKDVDPEKTYWYMVAAYGKPVAQDETVVVRRPQGEHIQDFLLPDGTSAWRTVSAEEVSAKTPSNITFDYRGAYINPDTGLNTARMAFRIWADGAWEEYARAEAVEGGEIVGSRYDRAEAKTVRKSSGHFLVEFGEETRPGVMVPLRFVKVRKGERGEPFRVYDDASRRHIGGEASRTPAAPARREVAQSERPSGQSLSIEQLRAQLRGAVSSPETPTAPSAGTPVARAEPEVQGPWSDVIAGFKRPTDWVRASRELGLDADLQNFLLQGNLAAYANLNGAKAVVFHESTEPAVGADETVLRAFFSTRWNMLRDAIPIARSMEEMRMDQTRQGLAYAKGTLFYRKDRDLMVNMISVRRGDAILYVFYVHPANDSDAVMILGDILNGIAGTG